MLDPKLLRDNPDAVKHATKVKRVASPELVDQWRAADQRRRELQTQADTLRAEQRKVGDHVGQLKRQLKGATSPDLDQAMSRAAELKTKLQVLADDQTAAEAQSQ